MRCPVVHIFRRKTKVVDLEELYKDLPNVEPIFTELPPKTFQDTGPHWVLSNPWPRRED